MRQFLFAIMAAMLLPHTASAQDDSNARVLAAVDGFLGALAKIYPLPRWNVTPPGDRRLASSTNASANFEPQWSGLTTSWSR